MTSGVPCRPSLVTCHGLKIADEGFFLEAFDPLLFEPGLFLGAQGFFDFVLDFAQRLERGRAWVCSTSMR